MICYSLNTLKLQFKPDQCKYFRFTLILNTLERMFVVLFLFSSWLQVFKVLDFIDLAVDWKLNPLFFKKQDYVMYACLTEREGGGGVLDDFF